jgi:hypothetical protein
MLHSTMNSSSILSVQPTGSRLSLGLFSVLAAVSVAASAATQEVEMQLGGKLFGHAKSLTATSTTKTIAKSKLYQYKLSGTIRGKGGTLGKLLPADVPFDKFLASINPGADAIKKIMGGSFANPSGNLGVTLLDQDVAGSKKYEGVGKLSLSLAFASKIAANGQISIEITDVQIKNSKGVPIDGALVFGNGSKLAVSTAPIVEFKATGQPSFAETAGQAKIIVWRQGNPKAAATVSYSTADGTALADVDYTRTSGIIQFAPGELTKEIVVPLIASSKKFGYRTFRVNLSSPGVGTVLGSKLTNTIAIAVDP